MRIIFFFFTLFTLGILCQPTLAQQGQTQGIPKNLDPSQIDPSMISSINIDDLSDAQLRILLQRFEESGLTMQELELALKSRGMSAIQLQKLKTRIAKLQSSQTRSGAAYDRAQTRETVPPGEDQVFQALTKTYEELLEEKEREKLSKIFGYNLFNSEMLTFEPSLNVPTPRNYTLGPGDEVIIDVWGASEQTYQQAITPDGYIRIPNLGLIYVNGLAIERASERIIDRLTKIYSGLRGPNPNTFAQVSLGQVRTIRVSVIGEALRPGTFNISSLSTIGNVLYLSGGPNLNGSIRNIELIREGDSVHTFDAYNFLIKGELAQNIRLQDQDIVRILPYQNRVEVMGEVKRPGIYEVKEGETFADLIGFAGGFTENAYSGLIKVRRNNGFTKEFLDLRASEIDAEQPQNGDEVIVEGIVNRFENRVQIRGAVFREGEYQLSEGLSVMGLIEKAQGLRGDAFLERGTIYRTKEDYTTEVISFNVRQILKNEAADIPLSREDIVNISSIYDLREEYYIQVFGEVKYPGIFPFTDGITVEDLLLKAGGLRESASNSQVEVARRVRGEGKQQEINETAEIFTFSIDRNLGLSPEASGFVLQPFDQLFIRRSPAYQNQVNVKVEGEVNFPGFYSLKKKDERISDIIKRSGGLTIEGYAPGATLIRRTEFNPTKSEELLRLENLQKLKERGELNTRDAKNYGLSETEELLLQRLENIEEQLEMYEMEEETGQGREGLKAKRRRIARLLEEDSLAFDEAEGKKKEEELFFQYETIGIDMEIILRNPGSKYDLILQEGDIISVPKQLETVRLRGEFLYPITVRFDEKNSFRDYISQAGGYTDEAKKSKTYVLYANGSVDRTRKILFWNNYPEVRSGAEIIVPEKPERRRMSASEVVAISSSLATIAFIVSQIVRSSNSN